MLRPTSTLDKQKQNYTIFKWFCFKKTWEWEESLFPSQSYQLFELKKKLKAKENAMKEQETKFENAMKEQETKLELQTTQLKERTTQLQHTQAKLDLMEIKYR